MKKKKKIKTDVEPGEPEPHEQTGSEEI